MRTRSNEQLCALAQSGGSDARNLLLSNNMGFIRKTANDLYRSADLTDSELGIEREDLEQEGSIGLLNAISSFDAGKGVKFLTYAAPAIQNAMMDLIRSALSQFELRITAEKTGLGIQCVRLDDVLPGEERLRRIEAIADPHVKSPEQIYIQAETRWELYAALGSLSDREQTYLLYRYGFMDDIRHPLSETAAHFHLSETRAKRMEAQAMDNLWLELPWWF